MSVHKLLDAAVAALNGHPRAGQIQMLEHVDKALHTERHLVIQAGTGTGKSLAYLVPALHYAQETEQTVVVSTATIALQQQLIKRDLPRLAEALEPLLEKTPTFAMMKGKSNYLCKRKLDIPADSELAPPEQLFGLERAARRLAQWAAHTQTGDRDDLSPGVSDLVWSSFSSSSEECVGASKCPFGKVCFAEQARQAARDVDIVVTNHALLAIDAMTGGAVLPEHSTVIVDEAHELEDRVTSLATEYVGHKRLSALAKQSSKLINEQLAEDLKNDADILDQELSALPEGRIRSLPPTLEKALTAVKATLRKINTTVSGMLSEKNLDDDDFSTAEFDGDASSSATEPASSEETTLLLLERQTSTLCDVVSRMLAAQGDVVWVEALKNRSDEKALKVAPIHVSDLLSSTLFEDNTVILTSATLALGGSFDAMATTWGLAPGTWDSKNVGTPFKVDKSGILYIEEDLDNPSRGDKSEAILDVFAEFITAAGGRTLGLFTSHGAAKEAAEAMRKRLPYTIYLQGEDSMGNLVEAFRTEESSCLFGTLSLWQGVDVPGSALNLVIIDRIPFPRPDDPLIQARQEAAGASGFMAVSATHAALLLAQGAGRLLRSITDRGVVAIFDRRLGQRHRKSYTGFLRKTLPNYWSTSNRKKVLGALRRLAESADSSEPKTVQR